MCSNSCCNFASVVGRYSALGCNRINASKQILNDTTPSIASSTNGSSALDGSKLAFMTQVRKKKSTTAMQSRDARKDNSVRVLDIIYLSNTSWCRAMFSKMEPTWRLMSI